MLRKRLAARFAPIFLTIVTGMALASPPAWARGGGAEKPAKLADVVTFLHAVTQWSGDLSKMADKQAKSGLVKDYAHQIATSNSEKDAKLMALAKEHEIDVGPLDPQTDEGKSLVARMKAETTMLGSLQGDAFDKEYMTLVTNTQQSVINFLKARKAAATDPDAKKFMGDLISTVQKRLQTAQSIMTKVYGDSL